MTIFSSPHGARHYTPFEFSILQIKKRLTCLRRSWLMKGFFNLVVGLTVLFSYEFDFQVR